MRIGVAFVPYLRADTIYLHSHLIQVYSRKTEQEAIDLAVRLFFWPVHEEMEKEALEERLHYNNGLESQFIDVMKKLGLEDGDTASYVLEALEMICVFQRNSLEF